VELRRPDAIRLLVAAGFSVHGDGRTTPLHQAAYGGDLELARLLVELGADVDRPDPTYQATPLGWAEHAHADAMAEYLRSISSARPTSAGPPGLADPD
jgi:ankyrin repeat protein